MYPFLYFAWLLFFQFVFWNHLSLLPILDIQAEEKVSEGVDQEEDIQEGKQQKEGHDENYEEEEEEEEEDGAPVADKSRRRGEM